MVEETAIRVQINAAKLAGQGIFGILQAVASMLQARQYGQQSIQSLNRQSQALASVELNDKTLPYVRRQLKEYSVDFAITKDKDTGQLNLWFKGQDVDRIQTAIENCIAARGKERPTSLLQELSERAMQRTKELNQHRPPAAGAERVSGYEGTAHKANFDLPCCKSGLLLAGQPGGTTLCISCRNGHAKAGRCGKS
ncbi:MAG: PcfB family protein [Gemmiger formicilis]|uniref:PcfB family protein n=1 Tax=Gemmiger formicilis TaxID=745368 RepID=UPI003992DD21